MIKKLDHTDLNTAGDIYSVFQVSYAIEAGLLGVTDFPPLCRPAENIRNSETIFFGYYKDDCLAAVMELMIAESTTHICSLVVHPQFFRQGIANRLLRFAEGFHDSKIITVETGLLNGPAINLYQNFGFTEQRRWPITSDIIKVRFCKILSQP